MIKTFSDAPLKRFWVRNQEHAVSPDYRRKIKRILMALDRSVVVQDMDIPGYRLHQLSGDLEKFWSVRVSANWRIIFRFEDGNAFGVDLIDYHQELNNEKLTNEEFTNDTQAPRHYTSPPR